MKQLEIQYFWPLTEQIPLGLNYEGCEKPKPKVDSVVSDGLTYTISNGWDTGTVSITAAQMNLDVDTTVIKMKEKPGLCRRTILKCLGLKWEIK
jgi:hypothetical protein